MLRLIYLVLLLLMLSGLSARAQDLYRDWDHRVCPVLDTPYRTYRGFSISHTLATDTQTTGWGDSVSVTDVAFWGRLPSWENNFGGELEIRGHGDLRILEGFKTGSGVDRQHSLLMLRASAAWHQRYRGGFGWQARAQPGIYTALSEPSGNIFSVPLGVTFVQALTPEVAIFAGVDYYPDFDTEVDPVAGFLYSRHDEIWIQLAYPETRLTMRPYGGRFQFGVGADFVRWPEYRLGHDDERRRLQFHENQAYAEISWDMLGSTQVELRAGYTFGRKAIFPEDATVAFDDAPFIAIGFSGLL